MDQFLNFRIENLRVVGNEAAEAFLAASAANGDVGADAGADAGAVDPSRARWPHLVS